MIHIYVSKKQPATNYVDRTGPGKPMRFRCSPLALRYCSHCRKRHRAKNMVAQVYYDQIIFWCRDEKKCFKTRPAK